MKKLTILIVIFFNLVPNLKKGKLSLCGPLAALAQYGDEYEDSWADDFFDQYGGTSAGEDYIMEVNAELGYLYTGGDPYDFDSYVDVLNLTGNPYLDSFLENEDEVMTTNDAVKGYYADAILNPESNLLPEVLFEDIRNGNWPWWWGDSDLFMNGGIEVNDLWKLYQDEDPDTYPPFDYDNPVPQHITDFRTAVIYYGMEQAILKYAPRLNSTLEKDLFQKYWSGELSNGAYLLSTSEFNDLKAIANSQISDYLATDEIYSDNNNNPFYIHGFNTYSDTTYDFAIGSAYAIYDSSGNMVGVFDFYNFDPANRDSWFAELATRGIKFVSPSEAADFYINAGNYPLEIFEQLKP